MYGKKWDGLLGAILKAAPLLAERLAGAEACWPRLYPSLEFLTALYIVFPPRLAWVVSAGDQMAVSWLAATQMHCCQKLYGAHVTCHSRRSGMTIAI